MTPSFLLAVGEMHISPTFLLVFALALGAGGFFLLVGRKVHDDEIEGKRECQSAAGFFQEIGLPDVSALLNALVLGDWKTFWKELYAILSVLKNKAKRTAVLATVVDTYIADVKQANNTAEVARLQGLLAGTAAEAAAAKAPTGAALQAIAQYLNPIPPGTPAAGSTTVIHQPAPVLVQPPATQTTIASQLVASSPGAAAAAAVKAPGT